ncbi:choline ABC transporter permease subunit [Dongia sp.]|uniref:choline ABC transporter permease subunit n=1 Tax=Dongia sp. TaxID=1977262 RepID=UPI003752F33C
MITGNKIPVGIWAKAIIDWIKLHLGWLFDFFSKGASSFMDSVAEILNTVPPIIFILVVAALALWRHRDWKIPAFVTLGFLFIWNISLWDEMINTLVLVFFSTVVSLLVGIPLGIISARRKWLWNSVSPVLDLLQTLPTFVYLVPAFALFGLGMVPAVVATFLFAVAAPARLTYLGISQVPTALVEAGESFGCTRGQLLFKVTLPAALPSIMAGVTQCIMLSLSMVVIAAYVGAPGLGVPVVKALASVNVALGFESGLAIVVLAIILDRILKQPTRRRRVKKA